MQQNIVLSPIDPERLISDISEKVTASLLSAMVDPRKQEPCDTWLNLNELCQYHPDKPSKQTVYGWVHAGLIPVHKGGKRLRFLKSEIDAWLKQGRKKTVAEISAEADQYLAQKKGGKYA